MMITFGYAKKEGMTERAGFLLHKASDNYAVLEITDNVVVDLTETTLEAELAAIQAAHSRDLMVLCEKYGLSYKLFNKDKMFNKEGFK